MLTFDIEPLAARLLSDCVEAGNEDRHVAKVCQGGAHPHHTWLAWGFDGAPRIETHPEVLRPLVTARFDGVSEHGAAQLHGYPFYELVD